MRRNSGYFELTYFHALFKFTGLVPNGSNREEGLCQIKFYQQKNRGMAPFTAKFVHLRDRVFESTVSNGHCSTVIDLEFLRNGIRELGFLQKEENKAI